MVVGLNSSGALPLGLILVFPGAVSVIASLRADSPPVCRYHCANPAVRQQSPVLQKPNPEQEYQTTSGGGRLEACELASFDSNALPTDTTGRCHDGTGDVSNDKIQDLIDANPNYNSVDDIPFAYIPRDHRYRQNTTNDEREALFGSVQWQPTDRMDITLDYQYSERDQQELRKDLQWGSTQEDLTSLTSDPTSGIVFSSISSFLFYIILYMAIYFEN